MQVTITQLRVDLSPQDVSMGLHEAIVARALAGEPTAQPTLEVPQYHPAIAPAPVYPALPPAPEPSITAQVYAPQRRMVPLWLKRRMVPIAIVLGCVVGLGAVGLTLRTETQVGEVGDTAPEEAPAPEPQPEPEPQAEPISDAPAPSPVPDFPAIQMP